MQNTIKWGVAAYLALTLLILPTGICDQQEQETMPTVPAPEPDALTPQSDAPLDMNVAEVTVEVQVVRKANDPPFHEYILLASETYAVDAALIRAIILAESSFNPRAVSKRGAQGLMQLMPATARSLGVEDSFDPAINIDAGVRYFRKMLDRFDGDVRLALAAYNAGSRHVRNYGGVPPFRVTRQYIKKVLQYQSRFQSEKLPDQDDGPDSQRNS